MSSVAWGAAHEEEQHRAELIVVATLIDKAPNLGGLARTCEIFRAARLVVASLDVAKHPDFLGLSLSAEQWLPMEAVPEAQLLTWLQVRLACLPNVLPPPAAAVP